MFSKHVLRSMAAAAAIVSAAMGAPAAHAVPVVEPQTFYFNANCADCAADLGVASFGVLATLVLHDYTPGQAFDLSHLVSFAYSGSNRVGAFELVADAINGLGIELAGLIPAELPAAGQMAISWDIGLFFHANADGTFRMCARDPEGGFAFGQCRSGNVFDTDMGTGRFDDVATAVLGPSPVPEPAGALMLGLGLAGLAAFSAGRRTRPQA